MKKVAKWLLSAAIALAATAANSAAVATIDKMFTSTFGGYGESYVPGSNQFVLFSIADYYQLSDGSQWDSGAGWHPSLRAKLASVTVVGDDILYRFNQPADGVLFRNTDYSFGDHSAQGELGTPSDLVIIAKLGGTTAMMSGYTMILSNTETWYGDLFNHYSAPVGSSVFFSQTYTLLDTTFDQDLFNRSFRYNEGGFVDFTSVIPEPGTCALLLVALAAAGAATGRRRI